MNLKALAIAAGLATTSLFAGSAQASTCFEAFGGSVCNTYRGQVPSGQVYNLGFHDGTYSEAMTVICNGRNMIEWESKGNLNQDQAAYLATEFCALPN